MLSVWIVTLIAILHRSGLAIAPATANLPLAADGSLSTPSKTAFNKSVSNKPINKSQADNESEIADLLHLAETQIDAADYEKAIATYQNAIAQINQLSTDNIDLESIALTGIADAYAQQHNYAAALPFFEQALALFTEPDHTRQTNLAASDYAEALIWITTELGQIHEYLAHFGTALAYYQQLLTPETSELLEPYTKADLLLRKGIVETEIGQYTQAETTLKASIALIQSLEQSPNQTPEQTPNQSLDASLLLADAIAALAWT
ncbi:MAG: tetratricopeptide repeat protein, partial [Cyanobacteria bacterium J06650_10]